MPPEDFPLEIDLLVLAVAVGAFDALLLLASWGEKTGGSAGFSTCVATLFFYYWLFGKVVEGEDFFMIAGPATVLVLSASTG